MSQLSVQTSPQGITVNNESGESVVISGLNPDDVTITQNGNLRLPPVLNRRISQPNNETLYLSDNLPATVSSSRETLPKLSEINQEITQDMENLQNNERTLLCPEKTEEVICDNVTEVKSKKVVRECQKSFDKCGQEVEECKNTEYECIKKKNECGDDVEECRKISEKSGRGWNFFTSGSFWIYFWLSVIGIIIAVAVSYNGFNNFFDNLKKSGFIINKWVGLIIFIISFILASYVAHRVHVESNGRNKWINSALFFGQLLFGILWATSLFAYRNFEAAITFAALYLASILGWIIYSWFVDKISSGILVIHLIWAIYLLLSTIDLKRNN